MKKRKSGLIAVFLAAVLTIVSVFPANTVSVSASVSHEDADSALAQLEEAQAAYDELSEAASYAKTQEADSFYALINWMLDGYEDYTGNTLSDDQITELTQAQTNLEEILSGNADWYDSNYSYSSDAIDPSSETDALALDQILTSLDLIDDVSDARTSDENFSGYEECLTNFVMLSGSAYTADVSVFTLAHVSNYYLFASNEGLAWGYVNPVSGWYTSEKNTFDTYRDAFGYDVSDGNGLTSSEINTIYYTASANGEVVGHYVGLFYAQSMLIGIGYTTTSYMFGTTASYNCASVSRYTASYTTDEMRGFIRQYRAYLADLPDALSAAETALEEAKEYVNTLEPDIAWEGTVTELYGDNRYETMAEIAQETFSETGSRYAVIATGSNFPDALAAASLAGVLDAPVILVSDKKTSDALETLEDLGVTEAYIIGGTSAVSEGVEALLEASGIAVERVYGENRFETAVAVAEKVSAIQAEEGEVLSDTCIVASGASFPDALSGSSYSYWSGSPIYLVKKDGSIDSETLSAIREGGYTNIVILGGTSAVSASAESTLKSLSGVSVTRLGGETRYETSVLMAAWSVTQGMSYDSLAIATGTDFPDALTGSALCGTNGSILLLAGASTVKSLTLLDALGDISDQVSQIYILGGESSISRNLRLFIQNALLS